MTKDEHHSWVTKGDRSNFVNADTGGDNPAGIRLFVCSVPRTMSNLFVHLFRDNEQLEFTTYDFISAYFYGPDRVIPRTRVGPSDGPPGAGERSTGTYQVAYDKVRGDIRRAEENGKIPVMKEHALFIADPAVIVREMPEAFKCPTPVVLDNDYENDPVKRTNPTFLPDGFMATLSPIFTIRHPAKMVGSFWREGSGNLNIVMDARWQADVTYRWSRLMFDWYKEHGSNKTKFPIVVDADDLTDDPEGIAQTFCELAGIDYDKTRYSWEAVGAVGPILARKLFVSTNVEKQNKPSDGYSIEAEAEKWKSEFGEEAARELVKNAHDCMSDYEYLKQFAIKRSSN